MPNWCENDLTVKGDKRTLEEFIKFVAGDNRGFCFNQIIPIPAELANIQTGFQTINGKTYTHWGSNGEGIEQNQLDLLTAKYGHCDWYNWAIENWGTKWDAEAIDIELVSDTCVKYTFSTAWSPPIPIIAALAARFSALKFRLEYYECGCGFKGCVKYAYGALTKEKSSDYSGSRGG